MKNTEIAACGLICTDCSIRKVQNDRDSAEKIYNWFITNRWIEDDVTIDDFITDSPYCEGCHGDRENHWSPDCWILQCCIDDRGLDNCSECEDFPCDRLIEWSKDDEGYTMAVERLKKM
ncbi:MAG: DUF3795 domain-containing protein [Thermoplasmatota archaeon]